MFLQNLKFEFKVLTKTIRLFPFVVLPVVPVAAVVDVGALPNVVALPNGRIAVELCKLVPNVSGCEVAGAAVDALAFGVPNVNVEFNEEGAAVPAAGVVEDPNRNPVDAGAAAVVVDVAPKAMRGKQRINKMKSF
jgi:hypothetical protein